MSLVTDVLATVFTITGVQTVANAFNTLQTAQEKLNKAQAASDAKPGSDKLRKAFEDAQEAAEKAGGAVVGSFIRPAIAGMALLVSAIRDATEEYTKFGVAAMNLRDITGASGADSTKAETLFRGFGINDSQVMRDMLRLSRDTITPKGEQSLGQLGIDPKSGATGLALLGQVADALDKVKSGTAKAALETDLFGLRGVTALQPYLRAGKAARDQMADLSTVTEQNLAVVQQWELANALLGATWEQKVVFPIMELVMPALVGLVGMLGSVIWFMGQVQQATGGWAGFAAVLLVVAGAVGALIVAWQFYNVTAAITAAWEAVKAAFMGNWGALAAGVAVATTIGVGVAGFGAWNNAHPTADGKDANTKALSENTAAINRQTDNLGKLNKAGGIPDGLSRFDIQQLARMRALAIIG